MADSKKYNGSTWEHSLRKLTTATDTITTLPADLYADGNSATVGLVGNMSQSGTPTPSNPVYPTECGDKTANLWSNLPNTTQADVTLTSTNGVIYFSGTSTGNANIATTIKLSAGTYTLKANANRIPSNDNYACIQLYSSSPSVNVEVKNSVATTGSTTFTLNSDTTFSARVRIQEGVDYTGFELRPMLNTGLAALPYEPYGQYKIPISSANTTTPVYLGEVQTERKIKKVVFTGQEATSSLDPSSNIFTIRGIFNSQPEILQVGGLCTHYKYNNAISSLSANMQDGDFVLNKIVNDYSFTIRDAAMSSAEDFKAFLQQQYANSTPVTVWYVLAEPTTGTVNEPLRKIGDYADTVSGISIPTITGKDSFDVLTTLKPSDVELTYTGWHDASVKEWDGSDWQ